MMLSIPSACNQVAAHTAHVKTLLSSSAATNHREAYARWSTRQRQHHQPCLGHHMEPSRPAVDMLKVQPTHLELQQHACQVTALHLWHTGIRQHTAESLLSAQPEGMAWPHTTCTPSPLSTGGLQDMVHDILPLKASIMSIVLLLVLCRQAQQHPRCWCYTCQQAGTHAGSSGITWVYL